jgi:ribonuclease P protein component
MEGESFSFFPFRVYVNVSEKAIGSTKAEMPKVGVGVSKRNFKKAVDRNRIKRLIREAYRTQKESLLSYAADNDKEIELFFIYIGKELPEYSFVQEKMKGVLEKLKK